jgi:hypothetical protein
MQEVRQPRKISDLALYRSGQLTEDGSRETISAV